MLIAVYVRLRASFTEIASALDGAGDLRWCRDVSTTIGAASREDAFAIVLGLGALPAREIVAAIPVMRVSVPAVPILPYLSRTSGCSDDVLVAVRAGIDGLMIDGFNADSDILRRLSIQRQQQNVADRAMQAVDPLIDEEARHLVRLCIEGSDRLRSVESLAASLGVHRKTVASRLRRSGLPSASCLLNWGRILHVAMLLEHRRLPIWRVAQEVFGGSPRRLREVLVRQTGLRPTELRREGLAAAIELFAAAVRVGGCNAERSSGCAPAGHPRFHGWSPRTTTDDRSSWSPSRIGRGLGPT